MASRWEPHVDDAAVRSLLTPLKNATATDAARQIIYLKLRVRLRDHVRRAGLVVDALIENCVDLTMARILMEFGPADAVRHFADGGELAWVFAVASLEAKKVLRYADADLIATSLAERAGDIASELEPVAVGATMPARSVSLQRLDALFACVRDSIGVYLDTSRTATRHENLAMYLRFTFTKLRHKELGRLYGRTTAAINQRVSLTRRELAKAAAHCFAHADTSSRSK